MNWTIARYHQQFSSLRCKSFCHLPIWFQALSNSKTRCLFPSPTEEWYYTAVNSKMSLSLFCTTSVKTAADCPTDKFSAIQRILRCLTGAWGRSASKNVYVGFERLLEVDRRDRQIFSTPWIFARSTCTSYNDPLSGKFFWALFGQGTGICQVFCKVCCCRSRSLVGKYLRLAKVYFQFLFFSASFEIWHHRLEQAQWAGQ